MRNAITYEQISPLVQYVEISSDMVQCHFHCPIKSKKIVAITRFSKFSGKAVPKVSSFKAKVKKFLGGAESLVKMEEPVFNKENAIVHAFEKISERFTYSDEHKHFVYKF